ncbi:unnamed protein product [Closterium sp. NIES-54]
MIHSKRGGLYLGEREAKPHEDLLNHMRLRQRNGASCPDLGDLQAKVALQLTKLLSWAGLSVAAAPPPLATAAATPAPAADPVAPPLLSPAVAATTPAVAAGTPALPSPATAANASAAAGGTPALLSPAVAATAPAFASGTPALLSPNALAEIGAGAGATALAAAAAAMTPPQLSSGAAVTPLLSFDAPTETAAAAAVTPLLSPGAAVTPLLSLDALTETSAAVVPSQTAPAPPSPTCLNTAHGLGDVQCAA